MNTAASTLFLLLGLVVSQPSSGRHPALPVDVTMVVPPGEHALAPTRAVAVPGRILLVATAGTGGLWRVGLEDGRGARLDVPHSLGDIAVTSDGSIWGIGDRTPWLFRFDPQGREQHRERLPAPGIAVATLGDDLIIAVSPPSNTMKVLWRWDGSRLRPWALNPERSRHPVGRMLLNWVSLAPTPTGVAVVWSLFRPDLAMLDRTGVETRRHSLPLWGVEPTVFSPEEAAVAGLEGVARTYADLVFAQGSLWLLSFGDRHPEDGSPSRGRHLARVDLATGTVEYRQLPGEFRVVAADTDGILLLVDEYLGVSTLAAEIPR